MSKSTFKILFYIRKNQVTKEGKSSIMVRLTVNGETSQFSSKLEIEPDLWDVSKQRMAGNTIMAKGVPIETAPDSRQHIQPFKGLKI